MTSVPTQRRQHRTTVRPGGLESSPWWKALASIGSPVALGTALLFYFGWVRSNVQADRLGYDISIAGYSTSDYVVRSINVLFVPFVVLVLLALGAWPAHERVLRRLESRTVEGRARIVNAIQRASWLWIIGGVLALSGPHSLRLVAIPVALTFTVLTRRYARALAVRLDVAADTRTRQTRALGWILLGILVFWNTERLALLVGEGYADRIAADPSHLVGVTIFSAKDLQITAPGVLMSRCTAPTTAYSYRYEGLRLLQRSSEGYVLLNQEWNPETGRVILVSAAMGVRLEFHRGDSPPVTCSGMPATVS